MTQQLGRTATLYLSGSHQTYWGTDDADEQLQAGLNAAVDDINWSLSYSLTKRPQQGRDQMLAININIPFSHWLRSDSRSVWRHASASYSLSHDLNGRMTNLAGLYGTLLEDNNLSYSMQTGYAGGGNGDNGSTGTPPSTTAAATATPTSATAAAMALNSSITGQRRRAGARQRHHPEPTVKRYRGAGESPGAGGVKVENQTGVRTDWRGYAVLPYATEYRETGSRWIPTPADNVDLDDAVVSVVPTHGAIVRANFNARGDEDPDDADPSRQTGAVWRPRHRRQQPERQHRRGQRPST